MKALIMYGSYGCSVKLAEIEKETDIKKLEEYREPEKLYKITKEYLSCKYIDINIKGVLKDINPYSDSIGFIGNLMESYIIPITDEQFSDLLSSKYKKIKNYYNKRIEEYYQADLIKRSYMISELTEEISKLDINIREEIYNSFLKTIAKISEEALKKAKKTGEKQILSKRIVKCNNPKEECNFDILIEYITPDNQIEEVRQHTY